MGISSAQNLLCLQMLGLILGAKRLHPLILASDLHKFSLSGDL